MMSQLNKRADYVCRPRARAPNFAQYEKIVLLDLVSKYKDIVENKKTDKITVEAKTDVWEKIEMEFNSESTSEPNAVLRTAQQLRNLYDHIKKTARKEKFSDKIDAFLNVSEISTKVLSIMEAVNPNDNPYDKSGIFNNNCLSEEESTTFVKIEKDIDVGSDTSQFHIIEPTIAPVSTPIIVQPSSPIATSAKTLKTKISLHGVYDELAGICSNKKAKLERNEKYEEELMQMKREKHELEMHIMKEKFELETQILKEQLAALKAKNDVELKVLNNKLEHQ